MSDKLKIDQMTGICIEKKKKKKMIIFYFKIHFVINYVHIWYRSWSRTSITCFNIEHMRIEL
jgi:hypothetical protein